MKLVVLHGAPGVGKLTVAKELQTLTGYRLFHNHLTVDLVASVLGFTSQPARELRERIWLDTLGTAAKEGVEAVIFTLVFEPTLLPGFWGRLVATVEAHGGRVLPFELRCTPEENARRIGQPDRSRYLKLTNVEVLRTSLAEDAYKPPPGIAGNVVIDTTRLSASETGRRIYEALRGPVR
jgi:hypothetical protein